MPKLHPDFNASLSHSAVCAALKIRRVAYIPLWNEVLCFSAPTFGWSFEIPNGDFYFGLGCEVDDPGNWKQEELPLTVRRQSMTIRREPRVS
jgi:hypothetical protein